MHTMLHTEMCAILRKGMCTAFPVRKELPSVEEILSELQGARMKNVFFSNGNGGCPEPPIK